MAQPVVPCIWWLWHARGDPLPHAHRRTRETPGSVQWGLAGCRCLTHQTINHMHSLCVMQPKQAAPAVHSFISRPEQIPELPAGPQLHSQQSGQRSWAGPWAMMPLALRASATPAPVQPVLQTIVSLRFAACGLQGGGLGWGAERGPCACV